MVVTTIILLRHGHRMNWTLDPTTGKYSSSTPYPTRLPADPPLVAHGVLQAQETGTYLSTKLLPLVQQDRLRIYSSLFYRCLETLQPTVETLRSASSPSSTTENTSLVVRGERGIGEWFGAAWFRQPSPSQPGRLRRDFFRFVDDQYQSQVIPSANGERIHQLHIRVVRALEAIIHDVDNEYAQAGRGSEEVTLLLCGHAAQIICAGRALTGEIPEDLDTEDFKCFTCGISQFERRRNRVTDDDSVSRVEISREGTNEHVNSGGLQRDATDHDGRNLITAAIAKGGIAGGWTCTLNSWCGHLSQGEERGWHFQGDESFDSYGPPSGSNPDSASGELVLDESNTSTGTDVSSGGGGGGGSGSTGNISKL